MLFLILSNDPFEQWPVIIVKPRIEMCHVMPQQHDIYPSVYDQPESVPYNIDLIMEFVEIAESFLEGIDYSFETYIMDEIIHDALAFKAFQIAFLIDGTMKGDDELRPFFREVLDPVSEILDLIYRNPIEPDDETIWMFLTLRLRPIHDICESLDLK